MGKIYINLIIAITFVFPALTMAQSAEWYANNQKEIDSLRKGSFVIQILDEDDNYIGADVTYSLKNHEFPWGTALKSSNLATDYWYAATARKYFNAGVIENAFKWSSMQPNAGPVNYEDVNQYLDWAESIGWETRGHTLLWGSKDYEDFHPLQKWVKDLPVDEMYNECKTRVQREMEYYKGRINEYDVMNEALPGHADWLQQTVGDSINWNAFKWAREADSSAKLYINDYSVITYNSYIDYINLIQEMLDNGAPIDGIGVQTHFGKEVVPSAMKFKLDSLATLGLPIKITEFDMLVGDNNLTEQHQAKYYALAMRTAFAHKAVNGFMFWGFWDERHWRDEAGFFTRDKKEKIVADSVYNLLHTTWSTTGFQTVSSTIPLEVNGYFGDYELEIEHNGEKRVVKVALDKANTNDTIKVNFASGSMPSPKITDAVAFDVDAVILYFDSKVVTKGDELTQFNISSNSEFEIKNIWQPENDSTQVVLELNTNITYRNNLTASYFPGTVKGANGSDLEFFGVFNVDNRIPGFLSGETNAEGNVIEIEFSKEMMEPVNTDIESFEVTVDGEVVTLTNIGLVESNKTKLFIELESPVVFGERVKFSYTPGNIQSAKNGILGAISPKLVVNKVPTSISSVFDKNNVKVFYAKQLNYLVINNQSANSQDYYYNVYNTAGIKLKNGRINAGETININANMFNNELLIVRFESLNRKVNHATKLIINK